jgi:type I restriction enzyme M protein
LAKDPETGELADVINDQLLKDMMALSAGGATDTLRFIPADDVSLRCAVPVYYDHRFESAFDEALQSDPLLEGFHSMTIGEMIRNGLITVRGGHGSPKLEQRVGDVPYIKVSDLRAGTVNINPTNRVPRAIAEQLFWGSTKSGLAAFDLISPERTSKNIGDFCVLMPGQEQLVVTKEVIILRPGPKADFDPFYLLWALTLNIVRDQWKRIVFMQTNREDVGKRYYEIKVPLAPSPGTAIEVSASFRDYYETMARARESLGSYLQTSGQHHFFVTGGEEISIDAEDAAALAGMESVEEEEFD